MVRRAWCPPLFARHDVGRDGGGGSGTRDSDAANDGSDGGSASEELLSLQAIVASVLGGHADRGGDDDGGDDNGGDGDGVTAAEPAPEAPSKLLDRLLDVD